MEVVSTTVYPPEESPFKAIYVDVTHRCQMACANCYLPNRNIPDMDKSRLYEMLSRLPHKTDLRLIGGEPTLRNDLPEIISEIKRLGHRPILITNGLRLADKTYCDELHTAGLRYCQLSMNGFLDDEIYLAIDKMACAAKKEAALRNCISTGITVSISCILVRGLNEHLVAEIFNAARSFPKPARINFRNVGAIGRNSANSIPPLSMQEIVQLVSKATATPPEKILSSKTADNQIRFLSQPNARYSQQIIIKITDWTIFESPVLIDPKARERGRITQDFMLAPHFEHVKANEFGY